MAYHHQHPNGGGASGSNNGHQQQAHWTNGLPLPPSVPSPYDDPASLLAVYPFATYTPTARVAGHFAPHTKTYFPPSSSSALYPQYAQTFARMDAPQDAKDMAMRQDMESHIAAVLQGPSYGSQRYITPTVVESRYAQQTTPVDQFAQQGASFMPPNFASGPFATLTSAPTHNGVGAAYTTPSFRGGQAVSGGSEPAAPGLRTPSSQPIPYNFLPPSPPGGQQQISTPSSALPSPAASASALDYFENYINRTLQIQSPSPSVSQAPTPARTSHREQADPLALDAPSPSKKHKSNPVSRGSPTPHRGRPLERKHSGIMLNIPQLSPEAKLAYKSFPSVSDPRSTLSMHSAAPAVGGDSDDDEIDWGQGIRGAEVDGDWEMQADAAPALAPPSGRTGDKDRRSALQKLHNLLDDIFEESDSLPANPSADDMAQARYFSGVSNDGAQPILSMYAMDKVVRCVSRVQASMKRSGKKAGAYDGSWDADGLTRLIRMLDKVMSEAEDLIPYPDNGRKTTVSSSHSPKKKGKKEAKEDRDGSTPEIADDELERCERQLTTIMTAASAALCCLVILDCDTLPKQLYSEDLLSLAVSTVRDNMTKILFPVVEGLAGEKMASDYLATLVFNEASAIGKHKASKYAASFSSPSLASIAQSTSLAVPHIASLVSRPDMSFSDSLVIRTVYLAIGPVFVREPASRRTKGREGVVGGPTTAVMKSLRMDAMGCLRGVFAKYEDQRQWIIEEILGSLGKSHEQGAGQHRFQLSNGSSISTLSALLLQLVQALSHGVRRRIRKQRTAQYDREMNGTDVAMAGTESPHDVENQIMNESFDMALRSILVIVSFLVQKSGAGKAAKSQDTDFKAILDAFVSDLLTVMYRPEWPAAALFLAMLSKMLMSSLEDRKSTPDANAARTVALDYLGDIATKIRALHLELNSKPLVPSVDEIISEPTVERMNLLLTAQASIQSFLTAAARDDNMFESSGEMTRIIWAQELAQALDKANSVIERLAVETDESAVQTREELQRVAQVMRTAVRDVWNADEGLFEINQPNQADEATQASLAVSRTRSLQNAFDPILRALVKALDLPGVAHRSKALRGLGGIVVTDPDVLSQHVVRDAIELTLSDSSPAVRDAAVDLIGKYVVQSSGWAIQYFPLIAERVFDSGLGVRKRVIKLLKDMFAVTESADVRVKICRKLIQATQDEDDGVMDLALKALGEILYPTADFNPDTTAALLVDILNEYKKLDKSLESALEGVSKHCIDGGHKDRFALTIDSLIARMVDATEQASFDARSHIGAIYLLSYDNPALIDTTKASVLITYLRSPTNTEEMATNDLLLRIFTRSIPFMPKTSSMFAQELSKQVRSFIGKPVKHTALPQPIACYCAVVNNLTKEYIPLISLLRGCLDKIRAARLPNPNLVEKQFTGISMLHYITALIAESGNIEAAAANDKVVQNTLHGITRGNGDLADYLFDVYLTFSEAATSKEIPILCLGALFRAHPHHILLPKAEKWMKQIFSGDNDSRACLLNMLRDFLESEAKRRGAKATTKKGVNDLIGSANDLHESGIATALVQRNIEAIVDGAKSHHRALQAAAMDCLAFTINQGLYHPLPLFSLLISLQTSGDERVRTNALGLHASLHSKHASILNVRYLEFAKASYDYQRTITSEVSGHRRGVALLGGWWQLLGEKRATRLEFLKFISKAFDFELLGQEPIDPGFVLYIAENLAVLEYHAQEEIMQVVQHLSQVVHDGLGVANAIELAVVDGNASDQLEGKIAVVSEHESFPAMRLVNASISVALALLTKNLLLDVYGLTEDKCLKYVAGKKSAQGEKLATSKYQYPVPLDTSRLPLARGVETIGDYVTQQGRFLQLMREDGSLGWSM